MLTQKMKQPFKTAQPVLFPPLADRAAWESPLMWVCEYGEDSIVSSV